MMLSWIKAKEEEQDIPIKVADKCIYYVHTRARKPFSDISLMTCLEWMWKK